MRHPFKMAVRFLLIVAVIVATAYVFAPPSSTGSPYASALSPLTIQSAIAAPPCENTICNTISGACNARQNGWKCKVKPNQGCQQSLC